MRQPHVRGVVSWEPEPAFRSDLCPGVGRLLALDSVVCGHPPDGDRAAAADDTAAGLVDGWLWRSADPGPCCPSVCGLPLMPGLRRWCNGGLSPFAVRRSSAPCRSRRPRRRRPGCCPGERGGPPSPRPSTTLLRFVPSYCPSLSRPSAGYPGSFSNSWLSLGRSLFRPPLCLGRTGISPTAAPRRPRPGAESLLFGVLQ